jgi:glycosyltransferase involved in cell wall biosynthesis
MRILIVHNRYREYGGEDAVFDAEVALLRAYGQEVETLLFDNGGIEETGGGKIKAALAAVYSKEAERKVLEAIQRFAPDVMHVHNYFYQASGSIFWAAKKAGVPVVLTVHNYRLVCIAATLFRDGGVCEACLGKIFPLAGIQHKCHKDSLVQSVHLQVNTAFHKIHNTYKDAVDCVIALTPFARQKLLDKSLGLKESQIVVKANSAPDPGYADPSGRGKRYLFVGRLTEEKGIRVVLEAAKAGAFEIDIIGGGPLKEVVESAAATNPRIAYKGFLPREVIMAYMRSARALIFPSIWYEGLPITIIEAYGSGLPVLASSIGNLNQIVIDGEHGFTFSPGNGSALLGAIDKMDTYITTDTHTLSGYDQLCTNVRKTYEALYTQEANYSNLMAIYSKLI